MFQTRVWNLENCDLNIV